MCYSFANLAVMFTIIIPTHNSERFLVPTLAALIPGAAAGLVREVIIADATSDDGTVMIAESAGCSVMTSPAPLPARLKAAAATARSPWLMFLRAGCVLDATWLAETERFLQQAELVDPDDRPAAVFRRASTIGSRRPLLFEAVSLLHSALGGRLRPEQGLIVSKSYYDRLGGHDDVGDSERDLLRRIGRRRTLLLRCGAAMAGSH